MPSHSQAHRWNEHPTMANGILWRIQTGTPWRDLPECYRNGSPSTIDIVAGRSMARGNGSQALRVDADTGDPLETTVGIDSSMFGQGLQVATRASLICGDPASSASDNRVSPLFGTHPAVGADGVLGTESAWSVPHPQGHLGVSFLVDRVVSKPSPTQPHRVSGVVRVS